MVATKDDEGQTIVYVVPLSHAKPIDDPHAVEVPLLAKRRLGLDNSPSWIVTSELNRFIWPGFDLRPISRNKADTFSWGFLPVEVFEAVKQSIARHQTGKHLKIVGRE